MFNFFAGPVKMPVSELKILIQPKAKDCWAWTGIVAAAFFARVSSTWWQSKMSRLSMTSFGLSRSNRKGSE
jgi:hypothetical protein